MADESDRESKTEEATDRRLQQAIDQGDVPVSREVASAAGLAALWLILALFVGDAGARTAHALALVLQNVGSVPIAHDGDLRAWLVAVSSELAVVWIPLLTMLAAAGMAAALLQSKKIVSGRRLKPDVSRLSPVKGFSRLFGKSNLLEFVKAVLKLVLLAIMSVTVVRWQWPGAVDMQFVDPAALPQMLVASARQLFALAAFALIAIAAADILMTRFAWNRKLRMSMQEVRDESKDQEGDPVLAARRKAIARSRIRKRLAESIPRATVVIANPTHYAVALRYVAAEGGAPVVVAKGVDYVALSIREMAEAHGVPVIENRALARSMHDHVKVDQQIPVEFYRAVADVLIVLQRRGRSKAR